MAGMCGAAMRRATGRMRMRLRRRSQKSAGCRGCQRSRQENVKLPAHVEEWAENRQSPFSVNGPGFPSKVSIRVQFSPITGP